MQYFQFKALLLVCFLFLFLTACVPGSDLASNTFRLGPDVEVLDMEASRRAVFIGDVSNDAIICAESPPEVASAGEGNLGLSLSTVDTITFDASANASENLLQLAKTTAALTILREQVEMLCFLTNFSRENLSNEQVARLFEGIIEASSKLAAVEVALAETSLVQAQGEQTVAVAGAISSLLSNFDIVDDVSVEGDASSFGASTLSLPLPTSEGLESNSKPTLTKSQFFELLKLMMSSEELIEGFGN